MSLTSPWTILTFDTPNSPFRYSTFLPKILTTATLPYYFPKSGRKCCLRRLAPTYMTLR